MKQRVARNKISTIKDAAENVLGKEKEIEGVFIDFFRDLFAIGGVSEASTVTAKVQPLVTSDMAAELAENFTAEEVRDALFQMHPGEAPGPDGMSALFYQNIWEVVGENVVTTVLRYLNNEENLSEINHTYIILIPKNKICEVPADYRSISLCNMVYKVVAKVLANRLKKFLPCVIHESHSGFVPGRLITDNTLVACECFHYMRKKKKGLKGNYLSLKLDMSKAYHRVECLFCKA